MLLTVHEDPLSPTLEIEPRVLVEIDDAECTVDDALLILWSALQRIEQACTEDPGLIADFLPRVRDQHETADRAFKRVRNRLCDAYAKHKGLTL